MLQVSVQDVGLPCVGSRLLILLAHGDCVGLEKLRLAVTLAQHLAAQLLKSSVQDLFLADESRYCGRLRLTIEQKK